MMKSIFNFDYRDAIRRVVKKILKDDYGIKISKEKSSKAQDDGQGKEEVFGVQLDKLPTVNTGDECYCPIPRFLVDAVTFLEPHLKTEGLFRKSGSLARQRTIREQVQNGGSCNMDISQSHDVANLLKQFLRELPDPILTYHLHSSFLKCLQMNTLNEQITSVLLVTLMIPDTSLRVLQYLSEFVSKVAEHSQESKMSLNNLAIILSPNIMFTNKDRDCDKYHKEQTRIVEILFRSSHLIGVVSDEIIEKVNALEGECNSMSTSSADELDWTAFNRQRSLRRRSRSISGFVSGIGRKIKGGNPSGPISSSAADEDHRDTPRNRRHRRSKSDKVIHATDVIGKAASAMDIRATVGVDSPDIMLNSPNPRPGMRALKRKAGVHRISTRTPSLKSPKQTRKVDSCQHISNPKLISMPNQFFLANRASMLPIMRSCENVNEMKEHASDNEDVDNQLSPNSGRHSLNLENFIIETTEKENSRPSSLYSVMRQKQLQKLLRANSSPNKSSAPMASNDQQFQTPLIAGKQSKMFLDEQMSSASSCPTPSLNKRSANNWQRFISIEDANTTSSEM